LRVIGQRLGSRRGFDVLIQPADHQLLCLAVRKLLRRRQVDNPSDQFRAAVFRHGLVACVKRLLVEMVAIFERRQRAGLWWFDGRHFDFLLHAIVSTTARKKRGKRKL
jgi:hypothetical protein